MYHNDITIFVGNYGNLNNFCKFQQGGGANALLKNVGCTYKITRITSASHLILLNC